ncbi:MAG: tRNA pseudouridine(38-40) synthase TruA [Bacteroidota bacterium]
MARFFFEISYHGKNYNGWQTQSNGIGVQTVVEDALGKLLQQDIKIVGSGRTDTGVHCEQQFFHTDIDNDFDAPQLIQKLNSFLPKDIAIRAVRKVANNASARYDAIERTYRYQITRVKNPMLDGLAWHYFKTLDVQTMNRAAALLLGEHDFECFSKVKTEVNHFLCTITMAEWKEEGDRLTFFISANRFLRGMVRAIVGTLLDVGTGKISTEDFQAIIRSRDRRKAGANVPPHGLYLIKVKYPSEVFVK